MIQFRGVSGALGTLQENMIVKSSGVMQLQNSINCTWNPHFENKNSLLH